MKFTIATLAAVMLVVVAGCRADTDTEPERFRQVQRIGKWSSMYEDTETGEYWIHSMGGFGADTWTRVDSGDG